MLDKHRLNPLSGGQERITEWEHQARVDSSTLTNKQAAL